MAIRRVRSKWAKTKALLQSRELRPYVPLTKRFSRTALHAMLEQYDMVYMKPIEGTFGKGVIRVERFSEPSPGYRYQIQKKEYSFETFDELYRSLQDYTARKGYLVQKGIDLLTYRDRRFDIRVMIQKNLSNRWETTGFIGRLSHPDHVVTNYHSGGTILSLERLLSEHLSATDIATYKRDLKTLGVMIGRQLSKAYPGLKELGADIAIDTDFHPWILEVNTKPHLYAFKLIDSSMQRKVTRYAKAYGGMK